MTQNNFAMASCICSHGHSNCAYHIAQPINPHMNPNHSVDLSRALKQHAMLKEEIISSGGNVFELPFVCGAPDSVFVKDSAILIESPKIPRAWLSVPKFPQRRAEQLRRSRDLSKQGFHVKALSQSVWEGGDLLVTPSIVLLGYGFRSELNAAFDIERAMGREVLPLKLIDPWLYHLDTALSILDETIFICEQAFDEFSIQSLKSRLPEFNWVNVPREEALKFCMNCVELNRQAILPSGSQWMENKLHEWGFMPKPVEMGEFLKAGGGPACLVAKMQPPFRLNEHCLLQNRTASYTSE